LPDSEIGIGEVLYLKERKAKAIMFNMLIKICFRIKNTTGGMLSSICGKKTIPNLLLPC